MSPADIQRWTVSLILTMPVGIAEATGWSWMRPSRHTKLIGRRAWSLSRVSSSRLTNDRGVAFELTWSPCTNTGQLA